MWRLGAKVFGKHGEQFEKCSQDPLAAWLGILSHTLEPPIDDAQRWCAGNFVKLPSAREVANADSCQESGPRSPDRSESARSANSIGGCGTRGSRFQVSTLRPRDLPSQIDSIRYLRQ